MQENYLELLKIYYDEWKYRHEHFWKTLIRFFVVIFFTSTLPITIHIFNGAIIPNIPLSLFPVTGIFLTIFYLWYGLSESLRLTATNKTIKLMIGKLFPNHENVQLTSFTNEDMPAHPIFYVRVALWIPILFSGIEFVISISMLLLVFTNSLNA